MKLAASVIIITALASGVWAQLPASDKDCPEVVTQDFAWGVVRKKVSGEDPKFSANSSGSMVNTKDNPINTVGNPVNMIGVPINSNPVRPQGPQPPSQVPIPQRTEIVQSIEVRRETYLLVKNSGNKIIKSIKWDYVFFNDADLSQELKRFKFHSKKKISPAK